MIALLLISCVPGLLSVVSASQPPGDGQITKAQLKLIFEKTSVFPENTEVSVAIIENGITKFYGIRRTNDSIQAIDNRRSIFEIGSITKVFTATLLADFVIEHQIGLDENINTYLKLPFRDDQKISFRKLANHTSGLPRLPTNLDLNIVDPGNPY